MATSLDRLGWFYGGKAEQQFGFSPSQHGKALHIFLSGLTLLGAYFFAIWLYSFSRLLFSIYLLPGKSVCLSLFASPTPKFCYRHQCSSAPLANPQEHGQSSQAPLTAWEKNLPFNLPKLALALS